MTPFLISGIASAVIAVGTDLMFASITKASAALAASFARQRQLGDRALTRHGQPAGATLVLAWIICSDPDVHVLAAIIREVLRRALVVSACASPPIPC